MDDGAHEKPVIGLTGGIGAGKSTVAAMLGEFGCLVVNSDDLAREALRDPEIKRTIRKWWGDAVFDSRGEVDRSAVARIVFNDPSERKRLEALTHPWIEARRREIFAKADPSVRGFVIDAPLLVEAGVDRQCDAVIFVDAASPTRLRRLTESRGWGPEDLERRERAQIPLDRKRESADHIVRNHGDLDSLREQVRAVLEEILLRHRRKHAGRC